jgi:hypothetical protein
MLVIQFGESIINHHNTLSFTQYDNVQLVKKRLMCDDVQSENSVFTGKGIHGFAALLFGILCRATTVVTIDAPSFLDDANKIMFNDNTIYPHVFNNEYQDILRFANTRDDTKIIMNTPITALQFNHTDRVRLMFNTIVTDDVTDTSLYGSTLPVINVVETVLCRPFRCGSYNNYFHYWVDLIVPIINYCNENKLHEIVLCNKEHLVSRFTKSVLHSAGISCSQTLVGHTHVVKGMNPKFVEWNARIARSIQNIVPRVCTPLDILFVRRPKTKRYINNDVDVISMLSTHFGEVTIIEPHDLDVTQQMNSFANARIVVGQFGSGLTNIMFMNKGTTVIEIDKTNRTRYDILCNTFGIHHHRYVYKSSSEQIDIDINDFSQYLCNLKIQDTMSKLI